MKVKTIGEIFHIQIFLMIALCALAVQTSEASSEIWKDAYLKAAEKAVEADGASAFYIVNLDGNAVPELLISSGDRSREEALYFWEEDKLKKWPCEYHGFHYIPGDEKVRITSIRNEQYTDVFYQKLNGQFIMLASGTYALNNNTPDLNDNGAIILNDKFTFSWLGQEMDFGTYQSAVKTVYDISRDTSPYASRYDLAGLSRALDSGEYMALIPGMTEDGNNVQQALDTSDSKAVQPESYPMTFISSDVSEYPEVRLYFSLDDENGNPITLSSFEGSVKESIANGTKIERAIRKIERLEGNQGLSIDIVADKSGSMEYDLSAMQTIMSDFVRSLDYAVGDQAEILSFDSYVMYMCTYTQDMNLLLNGISNMVAYGETALYDALIAGIGNAGSQAGARCVIGFTDGADNMSIYTPDDVIRLSKEMEVPVYLIGTGGADGETLNTIATATGGYYWDVYNITDVSAILSMIYRDQKDLYCIQYESDPGADPYAYRIVDSTITDGSVIGQVDNLQFQATPAIQTAPHNSRYELVKADVSWQQANDACIAKGGHLVTLTSQQEMNEVVSMCQKAGLKYCWIGGYTSVRNGGAFGHWITGEPFAFTSWYPGEPSRNDLDGTPEFYLMLWNVEGVWSWNDQRNDVVADYDYFKGVIGYVCEYED